MMTMISLTPTSAAMNFAQPEDSLPADSYMVSLRLVSMEQQLCTEDGTILNATASPSVVFAELSEFSVYNMTVTITNNAYRIMKLAVFVFATLSSG